MVLQAFEVQVCPKAETTGLEMAVLVEVPQAVVSVISQLFQGEPSGIQQVFDNLTVKHMDALRKQIQSLAEFVLNHCFWTYAMLRNFENDRKK